MSQISPDDMTRLFDCGLTLVDEESVEQFRFHNSGNVSVTYGTKWKVDKVFATVYSSSLSNDGR
jgi:hypothetical protein